MIDPDRRHVLQLSLRAAALQSVLLRRATGEDTCGIDTTKGDHAMSSVHDFDFLIGTWRLQHRRLKERLANCAEWEEFESTSRAVSLMGGLGNYDDNLIHLPSGTYCGLSLRAFDPKSGTWAIWWVDARNPHTLEVPVIGAFKDGVGTFLADDTLRGRPITVRFEWSKITRNSAHWEQAFTPDGGKTWETNWVNDLTRIA